MSKEQLATGDYIKNPSIDYIGRITQINEDEDEVVVVDEDSDNVEWYMKNVQYMEKEEAEKSYIIFPDLTDEYHGSLVIEKKILRVGCQEISFEKIAEIYEHIKNHL